MCKKIGFTRILALSLAVCLIFFVGCGNAGDGGKTDGTATGYLLNAFRKSISVDEEYQLEVLNAGDAAIVWSADDKKVVSVDGNGLVVGLKEGQTKVRARIGEQVLICEIKVEIKLSEYVEIILPKEVDDTLTLSVGSSYTFSPELSGSDEQARIVLTSDSESVRVDGYTVTAVSQVNNAVLTFSCDLIGVEPLTVYVKVV